MKALLGFALLLLIGLFASRPILGRARGGGRAFFLHLAGAEFLLLGALLGPRATGVIDAETIALLDPFLGLGLGYVGFVFGMQFERSALRDVPGNYFVAAAAQVLAGVVILVPVLWFTLSRSGFLGAPPGPLALAMAAAATGTSTSFLFVLERHFRPTRSRVFPFLRFCAVFEDLLGVLLFGVAVCWLRGTAVPGGGGGAWLMWVFASVAVGALSGGLLLAVASLRLSEREVLLFLVGAVLFSGGLAAHLRLSPVLTNLLGGVLFANLSRRGAGYHERLLTVEKPLYVLMLVLAGALWAAPPAASAGLALLYVGVRLAGKWAGGRISVPVVLGPDRRFGGYGFGLVAQSEMAVALMVGLLALRSDPATHLGVSAVFVAILLNGLLASAYFTRQARRA